MATLDALAGRQTEAALQLTQGAGAAMATDSAGVKTQAAQQTLAWSTPTAAAMRAAASATAQAQRTQAAAASMDFTRRQAEAASWAEFWATVRVVVVALLIVGGLAATAIVVIDRLTRIQLARLQGAAAIAREAFKVLPPGHWAEWQAGEGYQVYSLPGQLDEPARVVENVPSGPSQIHAWRQSVRLFCWWGERYGFSLAKLGAAGAGVVTDPAWRKLSKLLKDAGVLADVAIEGQKGRVTDWAGGWNFARLADELGDGRLALPFPTADEPPKIAFAVPTQHQN